MQIPRDWKRKREEDWECNWRNVWRETWKKWEN